MAIFNNCFNCSFNLTTFSDLIYPSFGINQFYYSSEVSKLLEMLTKLEPFKRTLLILKFIGLSKSESEAKWKRTLHIAAFLIFFVFTFLLFILKLLLTLEVNAFIKGLTIVPSQIVFFAKILNIFLKQKQILRLFEDLSNAYSNPKARTFLIKSLTKSIRYFKASSIFSLFMFISTSLTPIVTGMFSMPFYAPDFIENSQFHFFVHYILEVGMSVYCVCLAGSRCVVVVPAHNGSWFGQVFKT